LREKRTLTEAGEGFLVKSTRYGKSVCWPTLPGSPHRCPKKIGRKWASAAITWTEKCQDPASAGTTFVKTSTPPAGLNGTEVGDSKRRKGDSRKRGSRIRVV